MSLSKPKSFKKIGLFGSSHIKRFPSEMLKKLGLKPQKLSFNPKRADTIISSGRLDRVITRIIEDFIDLDAVFIFAGGNDIYSGCDPRTITDNILYIAKEFESIGVEPIIMPIINREKPWNMEEEEYNSIRYSINRRLREQSRKQHLRYRVLPLHYLRLEDGVHLTNNSYERLSLAIRKQMVNLTMSSLRAEGNYRFNETEYDVEYFYQ